MKDMAPLVARFFDAAHAHPNALFLIGKRTLTYGMAAQEVNSRAEQLARVASGLPVILKGPNTVEWVLCFLAARAAGLVVMPLSATVTAEQWPEFEEILGRAYLFDSAQDAGILSGNVDQKQSMPSRTGLCLPTSGSTGLPRCVLRSEQSLLVEGERFVHSLGFAAADRILAALPLCHAFTLGLAVGGAIAAGCALHILPGFAPRTVKRLLLEGEQSILPLVPATARLLCEVFKDNDPRPPGLRHIVIGAGPVTSALEQQVIARLGRLPARNYGSSETGATLGTTGQAVPEAVTGAALPGVEIAIAAENGPGALFVRTTEPFLGYLSPDGVDGSRTSPDGWYATGDWAICDPDGWVTVTGRIGTSLRRGGRSIQPAEVERALKSHPHVADVVVVGGQDQHGEDVVQAHVEAQTGARLDVKELHEYLAQRIPAYKIPTEWQFYDALPRTDGGKPDRRCLPRSNNVANRPDMALLSTVAAHRLSTATIAAHRLGILAALENKARRAQDIASELGLDPKGVEILLKVLTAAGLLAADSEGAYRAVEPLGGPHVSRLIEFEDCLRRTWLTVEAIEVVVRNGTQRRPFEADPGATFLERYNDVMVASAKALALHAWRRVTLPKGAVLDLGRPAGTWAKVVGQRSPHRRCMVFQVPPGYIPFTIELPDEPLAAIFIHNSVRRLADANSTPSLAQLCDALHPDGVLVISDIFIDAPAPNSWLRPALLLDWLTHGNLVWPNSTDLVAALKNLGFESIEQIRTDPMFDLFIAGNRKKKEKEIMENGRHEGSSPPNIC